ncbi:UDP-glycosyltransferase 90A2 [Carex littledalei]|uniref:UDP-glycosyltransferase 90A2 n=1 Tax=Carex littledalei TaxID=544730 RepID=A0A833QTU9_9POAL|nr:UDP-glycosyltransferase 90A2 [Carex littledalei]
MDSSSSSNLPHIAIFPFMSKGHTIPLLHLAHLLHHRRLVSHITFFTNPLNAPFIRSTLSSTAARNTSIITLPFPDNLPNVMIHKPHAEVSSPDEPFVVPRLTHLSLTKADLKPTFDDPDSKGPYWDFVREQIAASKESLGCVVNSFYKLESPYFDYIDSMMGGNDYRDGPLCLARLERDAKKQP